MTQRKKPKATQEADLSVSDETPKAEVVVDASHLDTFVASDLEADSGAKDDVTHLDDQGEPVQPDSVEEVVEQISKEAFFVVFSHAFGLPGMIMPDWKPLAIQPDEERIAREACNAIYEILEIYYPAALMPQGDMFARLATAAPFVLAKVLVVREILTSRRRAKLEAKKGTFQTQRTAEPGPEGEAPTPDQMNADPGAWIGQEAA